MLILEKIIDWVESRIGSLAALPIYTLQFELPDEVFSGMEITGLCMHHSYVSTFCVKSLSGPKGHNLVVGRSLSKFIKKLAHVDAVNHVILYTTKPYKGVSGLFRRLAIKRALINHERLHALLMYKNTKWHINLEKKMWEIYGNDWDKLAETILKMKYYSEQINNETEPAWVITEEALARIAAIVRAPEDIKLLIAELDARGVEKEILFISEDIKARWGSIEGLIGWASGWIDYR